MAIICGCIVCGQRYVYDSFSNLLSTEILAESNNCILHGLIDYFKTSYNTEYGEISASTLYSILIEDKDEEMQKEIECEMIYKTLKRLREKELTGNSINNVNTVMLGACKFFIEESEEDNVYEEDDTDEEDTYEESEGMRTYNYTFYDKDKCPITNKKITVSNMTLPQELEEYGFEELKEFIERGLSVVSFTYEEMT